MSAEMIESGTLEAIRCVAAPTTVRPAKQERCVNNRLDPLITFGSVCKLPRTEQVKVRNAYWDDKNCRQSSAKTSRNKVQYTGKQS